MTTLVKAEQKYVRLSPRKLLPIARSVRSLSIDEALLKLRFLNKRGAPILAKVIKQAVANATNNLKFKKENLSFHTIQILKGPTYKRWRPVSRGRAHPIKKRTSHIKVILKAAPAQSSPPKTAKTTSTKTQKTQPATKKGKTKKGK